MSNEQVGVKINTAAIAQFVVLASVATLLPFFVHSQWLTGPIVNALLILTLFLVGIRAAFLLALIPSLLALSGGFLPAVLAPAVPFIMIANAIFVLAIDYFYSRFRPGARTYWLGVVVAASLKYIFLYFSVSVIANLLIKQELALKVAQMMSWPQLFTALSGGALAFGALKWLKKI